VGSRMGGLAARAASASGGGRRGLSQVDSLVSGL